MPVPPPPMPPVALYMTTRTPEGAMGGLIGLLIAAVVILVMWARDKWKK